MNNTILIIRGEEGFFLVQEKIYNKDKNPPGNFKELL